MDDNANNESVIERTQISPVFIGGIAQPLLINSLDNHRK